MTTIACDCYLADDGPRELVILDGAGGSRLLLDRRANDGADPPPPPHPGHGRGQNRGGCTSALLADDGPRELVILDGAGGSRLLVDRRANDGADARLLAHLGHDEPDTNAWHVCREFLADPRRGARRLLTADFLARAEGERELPKSESFRPEVLIDAAGRRYFLRTSGKPAELRWYGECRGGDRAARTLSARDVVGALEA